MMDIINIVLTCVFLCVMNTGVIFIMDKIRKLTGDNGTNDYHCHSDCTVYRTDNN